MTSMIEFFQQGGPFMYPIALVLFVGLAISVERFLYIYKAKDKNKNVFEEMSPHLINRDFKAAYKVAAEEGNRCGVSSVIGAGIARMDTQSHRKAQNKRQDIEYAMEEGLMETIPKFQERIPYLATLANIATLLGLLGTIIGLISAFTAVADADPAEKAKLLSLSISVAMNTTAFGLMTAIPLLICHALLQTRTTKMVDSIEMIGVKFLNLMDDEHADIDSASNDDDAKDMSDVLEVDLG